MAETYKKIEGLKTELKITEDIETLPFITLSFELQMKMKIRSFNFIK